MDKNQAIGLVLLLAMMTLYFWFSDKPQPVTENTVQTDSLGNNATISQGAEIKNDYSDLPDSVQTQIAQSNYGTFGELTLAREAKIVKVSNEVADFQFSTKGGTIEKVTLRNYTTFGGKPLTLIDQQNSEMQLIFNAQGKEINIAELNFTTDATDRTVSSGDSVTVTFRASLADGSAIIQTYAITGDSYVLYYQLDSKGLVGTVNNDNLRYSWKAQLYQLEKDITEERMRTNLIYSQNNSDSELSQRSTSYEEDEIEGSIDWISFHQKFFTSSVIPMRTTGKGKVTMDGDEDNMEVLRTVSASFELPSSDFLGDGISMKYYFGPNDYELLKGVAPNFDANIYFGWGPLKWINKFFTLNVFNFLKSFIGNYGLIILIMVIIIRLILSPLTYKSHMSMAKMRVLKPELDAIKEKHNGDMQKSQPEQMQLYQKAGINPISGCIPMVLQMPILFSMFYFFPNALELRQESFLWAKDLSVYDSIMKLPFEIPFYGDHVSLFTLLMTASTILYTWSNSQVSTVTGPMKTVQYIMPLMFLFFLNSYSAGLTFYYFVSNIFSFSQIALFRKLVDEDKIKAVMEENKKKNVNKKKSKFASRLEDAMKVSEEARKQKKKNK
ncbi:MAG: membrane protein insertase YidC [Cyclobacteriaceae bacterium]